ncbi:MAG: septum formation protein Maf [Hyphomicrobiales bacterium]|nr:MAG: septum formation protein Maf [Hyphomicrobiales bacterium]
MNTDSRQDSRLILASASRARMALLSNAGLDFEVLPANIDEDALKREFAADSPAALAEKLASGKARHISDNYPEALVIGADQILEFDGRLLSKPKSIEAAREQLSRMRGRTHHLISAVSLARHDKTVWTYSEKTNMTMRNFSDPFLDDYVARAGERLCETVGAYQLESEGIQLFERIEGDFFTILGLPLLPLLQELRQQQLLAP